MPKQKSSASSATKKKHARKTAAREEQLAARAAAEELAELEEENGEENGDEEKPVTAEDAADEKSEPAAGSQSLPEPPAPPLLSRTGKKLKDAPPAHGPQRGQKDTQKQKKKQSKKHAKGQAPPPPRKKQYIPPPKPPKTNVDPVDIYGLGVVGAGYERIPADKVVSLRLLNKKDAMSVERGLDEMLAWVNELQQDPLAEDTDAEIALSQLSEAIPVWVSRLNKSSSNTDIRMTQFPSGPSSASPAVPCFAQGALLDIIYQRNSSTSRL